MKDIFMEWGKSQADSKRQESKHFNIVYVGDFPNKQDDKAVNKDDDFFCSVNGRDKF